MPRITMYLASDPKDPPGKAAPSVTPIHVFVPADQVADIWTFLLCAVTKLDVVLPALMALIACAGASPAPPKP